MPRRKPPAGTRRHATTRTRRADKTPRRQVIAITDAPAASAQGHTARYNTIQTALPFRNALVSNAAIAIFSPRYSERREQ